MRALRIICLLLAATGSAAAGAQTPSLPEMGAAAGDTLSQLEERALGREMMAEVRRRLPLLDDAEIKAYVDDLGHRIASYGDHAGQRFEFFVIDHPAINAFAMPGGYIGVHTGLILSARDESELAAVLAHEIAHVTQRHIARGMAAAQRMSFRTAAMLLAAVLVSSLDPEAGSATAMAGMAGSVQQQLSFSREFEREADNLGIRMLAAAGFDPGGMPRFFDRLQQATRYQAQPPEYLSTHPVTQSRIAESQARAESLAAPERRERSQFDWVRNKLRVLKAPQPAEAVAEMQARQGEDPADRYGLALALTSAGDYPKARELLNGLVSSDGERQAYLLALARLEQRAGDSRRALELHRQAQTLYPDSAAARQEYAQALVDAGRPQEAYRLLSRALPSSEPALYWLLARAASQAEIRAEPQLAMAEYYYLRGEYQAAYNQVQQVLADPATPPHQSARAAARKDELAREMERAAASR